VCSSYLFVTSVAKSSHSLRWSNARDSTLGPSNAVLTFLKWLPLLRGAKAVALEGETWDRIRRGPMALMFRLKDFENLSCESRWEDNLLYLERLSTLFRGTSEENVASVCISAIELLRRFMEKKKEEPETCAAFMWALEADPVFMHLLECGISEALLIFSSYCILLHSQSWRWWIKDWPANTIRAIEPMLRERWRGMLEWPLRTTEDDFWGRPAESRQATLQYTTTEDSPGEYRSESRQPMSECTNTPASEIGS
jgi:hypothetical protein